MVLFCSSPPGDQTKVQRLTATTDARAARLAYLTNQIVGVGVVLALWFVGFALLGFIQTNPDILPAGIDIDKNGDKVFPYFISYLLPPGISGLVVAAMLAAAMSSIDSGSTLSRQSSSATSCTVSVGSRPIPGFKRVGPRSWPLSSAP